MNDEDKALLNGPRIAPLAATDIDPRWLHQVREVVVRNNHKLRAGFPACIEVHGPLGWQALQLPSNGIEFTGRKDRDQVLRWLDGSQKLPVVPNTAYQPPEGEARRLAGDAG